MNEELTATRQFLKDTLGIRDVGGVAPQPRSQRSTVVPIRHFSPAESRAQSNIDEIVMSDELLIFRVMEMRQRAERDVIAGDESRRCHAEFLRDAHALLAEDLRYAIHTHTEPEMAEHRASNRGCWWEPLQAHIATRDGRAAASEWDLRMSRCWEIDTQRRWEDLQQRAAELPRSDW